MSSIIIKDGYRPALNAYETQRAIGKVKRIFEDHLCDALNLKRVSAPLFVLAGTGLNDDLSGVERPVEFDIPETGTRAQVAQSLAKWKRMALYRYGFGVGEGLYTDMNAIRRDEFLDNIHSIYVDQWDWEKVIDEPMRNEQTLRNTVTKIVRAVCDTQVAIQRLFPALPMRQLCRDVSFITTQELEDLYPDLTPRQREDAYLKEHKTAFIMQIGNTLKSGIRHDDRAPDYDDWSLNGDIFFWHEVLECAYELSSMGIRVDAPTLMTQLDKAGCPERALLPFHRALLDGILPLTMGGGIGQSRLCMLLLEKMHIGEVQVSIWDRATMDACKAASIKLL